MLRPLVSLLVVAAVLGAPAVARAQGPARTLLMPDVTYDRQVEFTPHGPVVVNVVTAPRPGGLYALRPVLASGVQGRDRLTTVEKRLSAEATVVGASGDGLSGRAGLIQGGVMAASTERTRSTLGIDGSGSLLVDRVDTNATWKGSGQRRPLNVNAPPASNTTTLYTRAWGPTTPPESGAVQAVLAPLPGARVNVNLQAPVVALASSGPTAIPPNGAVLVGRNAQAGFLATEAPVGTSVSVRLLLSPNWPGVPDAIGGGPVLVAQGRPVYDAGEAFDPAAIFTREARSAVGQTADGRILIVAVDGHSGTSAGMTNWELALTMVRLGAVTAMALDSGVSTTLAFDGQLLDRPGSGEQPVADALLLAYSGVYAAPPAVDVVSPNGDGVADSESFAYKLVRRSSVAATLVAPDGAVHALASGSHAPGMHALDWTPPASTREGKWTFRITATDDLGRTSHAERAVAVDDTLAHVTVAPAVARVGRRGGRVAAAFTLARAAKVTVTVETRSGSVVDTVAARRLAAGTQEVVWNGRSVAKRPVPAGRYVIRVRAASSVGSVDVIAPFRVTRR